MERENSAGQIDSLNVVFEGVSDYVATDRETKPLRVIVECSEGLGSGTDIRVVISTFHSFTRDWKFEGASIENGEGTVVLGHGLPIGWDEMIRDGVGPAGGGLVGRPVGELYLCTVQVTRSLSAGSRLVLPFHANSSPHADVEGSLQVKARTPESYHFVTVGAPFRLNNNPGDSSRLEARITVAPSEKGSRRLVVFATDDNLNPIPDFRGKITIRPNQVVPGLPPTIPIGNDGRAVVEGVEIEGTTPVRINGSRERE